MDVTFLKNMQKLVLQVRNMGVSIFCIFEIETGKIEGLEELSGDQDFVKVLISKMRSINKC